jgi:ketosteroid isomerase-like protein
MTAHLSTKAFDVAALVSAIENRDAEAQFAAYSDDAEVVVIDHEHPPSSPTVLRGGDALQAHLTEVCSRDMTHQVTVTAFDDEHLAMEVACRYPDGTRVACLCVSGISDGRISWQRGLQVWDH